MDDVAQEDGLESEFRVVVFGENALEHVSWEDVDLGVTW